MATIMAYRADASTAIDSEGRTPLMWAALAGNSATCSALLEAGAHPDTQDRDGRTALHLSALNDIADCVTVLLQQRANVGIRDSAAQVRSIIYMLQESDSRSLHCFFLVSTEASRLRRCCSTRGRTSPRRTGMSGHRCIGLQSMGTGISSPCLQAEKLLLVHHPSMIS